MTSKTLQTLVSRARAFAAARTGNVAMMFGLALVPLMIAVGVGLDMSRAMLARTTLSQALDAAGLAVGSTPNVTQEQAQAIAQKYFTENYKNAYGPETPVPTVHLNGQSVTLGASQQVTTYFLSAGGYTQPLTVSADTTVVWGQSKLWVTLALDNTGSMSQTDNTGTSKMTALKAAVNGTTVNNVHTNGLLDILRTASSELGDVQVAIAPFSKDVNVGTANVNATWISWTDWEAPPPNVNISTSVGPGSACPFTDGSNRRKSPYGYYCVSSASNGASTVSTVPSSGLICPGVDPGTYNSGRMGRYYNGCYNSVATQTLVTTTDTQTPVKRTRLDCKQIGSGAVTCINPTYKTTSLPSPTVNTSTATVSGYSGNSTVTTPGAPTSTTTDDQNSCSGGTCTWRRTIWDYTNSRTVVRVAAGPWNHNWVANSHSTWTGCVMDRNQSFDTTADTPSSANGSQFPAENAESCLRSVITPLPATWTAGQWTTLQNQVTAMQADGSTNQTVGLAHAMQLLSENAPYDAPPVPSNTTRYIILLSDGLNTQNRWSGDGSNQSTAVDNRMALACTNAKAAGFIIYTIFVDLGGTQGNSTVLQNCASSSNKYFDLTTSGAIITAFNTIGQQITAVRVSQ